jgi:WD40 repeat protein
VSAVAFAPDSALLASSGGPLDPTVKLWRLSDGAVVRTIAACSNGVMALAFSPDGSVVASGGDCTEQIIQLWNADTGGLVRTLAGHTNGVTALAFSPHGDLLASGGRRFDHKVKIWAVTDGSLVCSFTGHSNNIEAVAFAPDGNAVASGSSGTNPLRVWQISDGSSRNFGSGTNPVFAVAFTPDGRTLASTDRDTIKLWDVASGLLSETITQETFRVSCLAYSPNGNLFLHGREDGTVVLSANTRGALGRPPLVFQAFTVSPGGAAAMEAEVQPWTHYLIQSSTNLTDWMFLTWAVSEANSLSIPGLATSNAPAGFYRALTPP